MEKLAPREQGNTIIGESREQVNIIKSAQGKGIKGESREQINIPCLSHWRL